MLSRPLTYALFCIFLLLVTTTHSQNFYVKLVNTDSMEGFRYIKFKAKQPSEKEAVAEMNSIVSNLRFQGYLLAGIDSTSGDSLHRTYYLGAGQKYKWAHLKKGNADMGVMSHIGYSEKLYTNKTFNYTQTARLIEKTIGYYENNGYPFVSVTLDSVTVSDNSISATLKVEKNKLFRVDSIRIEGDAKVNKRFLYRYLGISPMMPYSQTALAGISKKLKQLPFLTETRGQELRLTDKINKLYIFLNKKNASQFDGILGILPDKTGKTILTGDVKIRLVNNIFRAGETFDISWRRLQYQTQDFNGHVTYPYLFGTPIGTDYAIKIYKRDTSFIDVNNNIGLQYYFRGLNNLKVYYKQRNANILSTSGLEFATTLPDYADVITRSYGLGLTFEKLDYRFNPHKGISINVNSQTGTKSIHKNPKINDAVYTDLRLNSTQYQFEGNASLYIQVKGNSVIRLAAQYGSVFGNAPVFKNELFRIGGLKTLRGFDEESIYASTFVIPTFEYRFLFGQNSNILVFAEGAWYENTANGSYISDRPYSFGAGINFDTKAGIFSLNYAIGSQFNNPIDFRTGKIHFGLTTLF